MQVNFAQHVKGLVEVMEELGNPFLEESTDLLRLDTRDKHLERERGLLPHRPSKYPMLAVFFPL